MGRPAKAPKLKEPVHIRERKRKDGIISLYLDIYQKGFRKNEYLNLYLVPERTTADKKRNADTLAIAERVKSQRIIALQNHGTGNWDIITKSVMPLEEWLEQYDNEDTPLTESAFANRRKAHKWMTMYLKSVCRPNIALVDLDKDFCRSFIAFLKDAESGATHKRNDRDLHQSTVHGYIATISAALNKAVREGIINRNPFTLLEAKEKVAKKDREREFLTIDEIKVLMDTPIDHESMKMAFIFACFTGLRISDILKLRWDDIKLTNDNVEYIHTQMEKTKEYVTVPLSDEARRWMPERGESDLVFYDLPKSRNTRNKSIRNWIRTSGIKKEITFHSSRHTFATLMLSLGTDLYTTSKLLGHKNVSTTEIYAKIIDQKKVDAVRLVDNLFGN
ncbi:MAG: site-specific integrase [Bacteroidales bacterium]|nr:site-specific integrase [Bacteroidales bacterium]